MAMTIYPYLLEGTCWVFDDERTGLKEEAFVLGMTEMISRLVKAKSIPNASQGFALTFGAEPFDHDAELTWLAFREDLAAELASWLDEKLSRVIEVAKHSQGQSCLPLTGVPTVLPAETPLFDVPTGLIRILDRDLEVAGIPKRDDRGRTLDVHALRHSFGTFLSKGGVAPRTAQAAMRHSTIDLTMNVYTDPRLLDVHLALTTLPTLPLASLTAEHKATVTDRYSNKWS
jgi:hypothetical protein